MAIHSNVKIWVHLIWGTHRHERVLDKELRKQIFAHLIGKSKEMGISFEKLNVQPEHIHCLLPLPSDQTIAHIAKSLKGETSRWLNEKKLLECLFRWQ